MNTADIDLDTLTTQEAAHVLHKLLPEPKGYWSRYLTNNRRPDRAPAYRIPTHKRGGSAIYKTKDITDFIEWEKRRRYGFSKVPGRASNAITVRLDPPLLEALEALQERSETPAAEILENLFPALLLDLFAAMDAVDQAAPGEERAALLAHLEKRKGGRQ